MAGQQRRERRIFVAGATGVLGRRVVPSLVKAGHQVTAMSRRTDSDQALVSAGAQPRRVSLFDQEALLRALAGHDTVINLATCIPPPTQALSKKAWAENDRIRNRGADHLGAAATDAGVTTFIQESITLNYRDGGATWIDESGGLGPVWNTRSALVAEGHARRFGTTAGRSIVLRFATLYAADAAHTQFMARYAARGWAPLFGAADAYFSLLHADDAANAVVAALDADSGTYNVVDNEPLTRRQLLNAMALAAGRKRLKRLPDWLLRLTGGDVAALLMRSQRVSNRAFRRQTGWNPTWPDALTHWPRVFADATAMADTPGRR
ncbi:MAG: NAD(P)-dependent oxidoreductase [Lysobacterales bacterium]